MSGLIDPILSALLPIVFVITLGWIAGRTGAVPVKGSPVLAAFVVKFALPVALFLASAKAKPSDIIDPPYIGSLLVGLTGTYALGYGYARVLLRRERDESALQALTCSFPNMAYCGPPVLMAAVGPGALLAVVIGNLVTSLLLVPVTLVLLEHHRHAAGREASGPPSGFAGPVVEALTKPLVILPFLGIVVALIGLPIPALAASAADEIGRAAGGAALFTLGLILSGISPRIDREIALNVLIQNILQPTLILAVAYAVGLRGDLLKAVFLIGVLPSASENAMLALANDTYREKAAASVMASTLFAILTISAGIAISGRITPAVTDLPSRTDGLIELSLRAEPIEASKDQR